LKLIICGPSIAPVKDQTFHTLATSQFGEVFRHRAPPISRVAEVDLQTSLNFLETNLCRRHLYSAAKDQYNQPEISAGTT
jgi:hypothetical protein